MSYYNTSKIEFILARVNAERDRPMIKANLCLTSELPDNAHFYLHADEKSGFALKNNLTEGDYALLSVFSSVKGRGTELLDTAVAQGATTLDCFDGFLVQFYEARGWVEYAREKNWHSVSDPDVVFMTR